MARHALLTLACALLLTSPAAALEYRVVAGDTLSELALRFGVTLGGLRTANGIEGDLILVGQVLRIPEEGLGTPPTPRFHRVRRGESLWLLARRYHTTVRALRHANGIQGTLIRVGQRLRIPGAAIPSVPAPQPAEPISQAPAQTATVRKGDTLSHIALRHGTSVEALMVQNSLSSTLIHPGQRLSLPSGSAHPKPAQPTPAVSGSRAARLKQLNVTQADVEILARIVKGEAPRHTPREGKVAVAAVVLNRVLSSRFPNSIRRVAHQPWQFSAYNKDVRARLYYGPVPAWAWEAAEAALAGEDPSGGATHYFNPFLVRPKWAKQLTFLVQIGSTQTTAHRFYK